MFKKKYFFFDIDGTLVADAPNGYIPESTKRAVAELRRKGHFCCIATGRSHAMAEDYCREIGFEHMVSDGGNGITIDHKLVSLQGLERDLSVALLEECEQKHFLWSVSPENSKVRYAKDRRFHEYTDDIYMQTETDETLDFHKIENFYKLYIACEQGRETELKSLKKLPYVRFHPRYIFVEPGDKARGVKCMMDYLGAPYEDVVVFGDGRNDLSMFLPIWTSIAMGNAVEELKAKADFVTKNVEDDGIEYALKHFGWI